MFKVNNKDIIVVNDVVLVSLLFTSNIFHTFFVFLLLMVAGWCDYY